MKKILTLSMLIFLLVGCGYQENKTENQDMMMSISQIMYHGIHI